MSAMSTLFGIRYSPWSLRSKWALDHHRVPYAYREYVPMLGAPELRVRLRDFSGRVTVPVLLTEEGALRDSLDIARWAESRARESEPLFSEPDEVTRVWTHTAEEICDAGRVLATIAVARDPGALRDNVPGFVPGPVRPLAKPLVTTGLAFLRRKYRFDASDADDATRRMRAALEAVGNRLETRPWLGESFGWSDVAIVCALQFVQPAEAWVKLGRSGRAAWTREELARDFADVLAWRDAVLIERRP
mgnify:CR=1 FL=1